MQQPAGESYEAWPPEWASPTNAVSQRVPVHTGETRRDRLTTFRAVTGTEADTRTPYPSWPQRFSSQGWRVPGGTCLSTRPVMPERTERTFARRSDALYCRMPSQALRATAVSLSEHVDAFSCRLLASPIQARPYDEPFSRR